MPGAGLRVLYVLGSYQSYRGRHGAAEQRVLVLAPGHPRASSGRYGVEHIRVMEEILGRYLRPGESVHHRNGMRGDNRPENLELWTRPQPSGIRASDALAPGQRNCEALWK